MPPQNLRGKSNELQDVLKIVVQQLKQHKEIPENGLALFAGTYTAEGTEKESLRVEELIPPEPHHAPTATLQMTISI